MVDVAKLSKIRRAGLAKRALLRMSEAESREQRLWLRVITMAIEDLVLPEDRTPYAAHQYFTSSFPFNVHAGFAGLDPDAVRTVLRQAQLIGEEHGAAAA